jgi:hypothetical protein
MAQCVGVKKDGVRCAVMVIGDAQHTRCGTHMATLNKVGPNQIRRDELKYTHVRVKNQIYTRYSNMFRTAAGLEYARQRRLLEAEMREEDIKFQQELHALEQTINRETEENGGVNADEPFIERQRQRARERHRMMLERREAHMRQFHQAPAQAERGDLGILANDRQNVHTHVVVQNVKETVRKVLTIPVPPEYHTDTLKTSGEIILECGLSRQAAAHMMVHYCNDHDIYGLGAGIYGRVLNSVWQYIKTSPDAADLKKILATEMQDNIGMCAQGNLSRLCNILSGYLDGINVNVKSMNEVLGERFALLRTIENDDDRVIAAYKILQELEVPDEQWAIWIENI